jgi:hypothetical protein
MSCLEAPLKFSGKENNTIATQYTLSLMEAPGGETDNKAGGL